MEVLPEWVSAVFRLTEDVVEEGLGKLFLFTSACTLLMGLAPSMMVTVEIFLSVGWLALFELFRLALFISGADWMLDARLRPSAAATPLSALCGHGRGTFS